MKGKIFKRDKVTRIIALILAMIMMSAPFFAHAGLKGDSKAEEAETKKNHTMTGITLTTDVTADKAKITKTGNNEYVIGFEDVSGNLNTGLPYPKTVKYLFASDYLSLTIDSSSVTNNINLGTVTDDNNLVADKTLSAQFDGKIYYSVGDGGNIQALEGENKITITGVDSVIYFYLKPVVTDDSSNVYDTAYQDVLHVAFEKNNFASNGQMYLPKVTDSANNDISADK